jgi:ribosomal protein S12 methylthiotransferase accessory factor
MGEQVANGDFVHYPNEKWFPIEGDQLPAGLLDASPASSTTRTVK